MAALRPSEARRAAQRTELLPARQKRVKTLNVLAWGFVDANSLRMRGAFLQDGNDRFCHIGSGREFMSGVRERVPLSAASRYRRQLPAILRYQRSAKSARETPSRRLRRLIGLHRCGSLSRKDAKEGFPHYALVRFALDRPERRSALASFENLQRGLAARGLGFEICQIASLHLGRAHTNRQKLVQ